MKAKQIQVYLLKVVAALIVLLVALGVLVYFEQDYSDDLDFQAQAAKAKSIANDVEYKKLDKEVGEANDAYDFYLGYKETLGADSNNYRREYAKNALAALKNDLEVPDLKFSMENFKEVGGEYSRKQAVLMVSKVTVQYSALSDKQLFQIMKKLHEIFPGSIRITSFKADRKTTINDQILLQIGAGSFSGLVSGEVKFDWRSIQDNKKYVAEQAVKDKDKSAQQPLPNGAVTPPTAGQPLELKPLEEAAPHTIAPTPIPAPTPAPNPTPAAPLKPEGSRPSFLMKNGEGHNAQDI